MRSPAMGYILDTHILIWWWSGRAQLTGQCQAILSDAANAVHISAASGWEMATKVRSGKLPEMANAVANFDGGVRADNFRHLDVRHDHAVRAGLFVGDHRDPFDRMIAAQALIEGL
ncbi:MAG: type II toxin-antitoxin system VapC family toxin, partial [Sphingomonas sp.]